MFERVVKFTLDSAGKSGNATGKFRNQGHDHVRLVDQLEVPHVDLAIDVTGDVEDLPDIDLDRFSICTSTETVRLDIDPIAPLRRCGKASITLRRNGRVLIRGFRVETRAEAVNRIKGGSVQIN